MKLQLGIEKEVDLIIGFKSTSFVLCAFFILLHFVLLEKITFRFIGPLHFVLPDLPLEYKAFIDFIYGKLVGDKGYIGKILFQRLFVDGIQLITKLKSHMKGALMSVSDKLLLRKEPL